MRVVLAIAWVELRRFLADRSNLFFVLILPLAMVAVIGWQFGSDRSGAPLSVQGPGGAATQALVEGWEDAELAVTLRDTPELVQEDVSRGSAEVGVLLDPEAEAAYRDGIPMELEIITGSSSEAPAVAQVVRAQAEAVATEAAQVGLLETFGDEAEARAALDDASTLVPPAQLLVQEPEDPVAVAFEGVEQFDSGAVAQLLLFVFLSTLNAAPALIKARRDGVVRRTMAAPVTTAQAMAGLTTGRVVIALVQGAYIMLASSLLFGVRWGSLGVAVVVLLVFGLVAAGVAMVIGVLVDSEGAASGLAVGGGLVLGAVGGSMVPLEFYSDTLRQVAQLTPHAWANDAMAQIQRQGAGIADVWPQLGVLAAMAIGVLVLGSLLLRRSLARAM
ncbi:ABC transporter permease [uncultured Serinicoccus sp.]|uniref:ABC transporter permease n=1 Tax=uncultured Serinicoccus sp. TaxID=735514 RepID=UPI002601FDDE|nr:ABC transporter permease [uncultured Serinicoccus sp.]